MAAPLRVRYDGPYSMSLGDSFFPTLVKNMLYWEVPRQVVALLTRRALGKKAETSEEKEFVVGAPSYILSLAHAVLISGCVKRTFLRSCLHLGTLPGTHLG